MPRLSSLEDIIRIFHHHSNFNGLSTATKTHEQQKRKALASSFWDSLTRAHLTLITLGPEDGIYGLKVEMINFPIYNIPFPRLWSFLWYFPNIIRRGIRRPNSFTLTQFWCVYKTNKGQGANDLFCMSPPTYTTTSCFSHLRVLHVFFLGFIKHSLWPR